jgi:hypothetical protein
MTKTDEIIKKISSHLDRSYSRWEAKQKREQEQEQEQTRIRQRDMDLENKRWDSLLGFFRQLKENENRLDFRRPSPICITKGNSRLRAIDLTSQDLWVLRFFFILADGRIYLQDISPGFRSLENFSNWAISPRNEGFWSLDNFIEEIYQGIASVSVS